MRPALACLPLALLFIANVVPTKAQKTAPASEAEVVVVVQEGAPLELACALRVEQRAEWRREGGGELPADLQLAGESGGAGGLTARLRAAAARPALAGVYSCARGPQAQRLRVVVEPRAPATLAAATDAPTTEATTWWPLPLNLTDVVPAQAQEGLPDPGALQYYDVGRNTSMTCSIPNTSGQPFVWEKNNTDISKVKEITNRYKLENNNAKLVIQRTNEDDYGNYTCKLGGEQLSWRLHARPYTKLPSTDSSVVEGQKLKLTCKLIGKPAVPVKWYYNSQHTSYDDDVVRNLDLGVQLEANERIKLETSDAGIENGQLVIEAAARADAGAYACVPALAQAQAQSPHPPAVSVLRVKDMYAALWPFLGICAEVLVLCAIILVYEKRRTKPELDDSDTDNHDQKKS